MSSQFFLGALINSLLFCILYALFVYFMLYFPPPPPISEIWDVFPRENRTV